MAIAAGDEGFLHRLELGVQAPNLAGLRVSPDQRFLAVRHAAAIKEQHQRVRACVVFGRNRHHVHANPASLAV